MKRPENWFGGRCRGSIVMPSLGSPPTSSAPPSPSSSLSPGDRHADLSSRRHASAPRTKGATTALPPVCTASHRPRENGKHGAPDRVERGLAFDARQSGIRGDASCCSRLHSRHGRRLALGLVVDRSLVGAHPLLVRSPSGSSSSNPSTPLRRRRRVPHRITVVVRRAVVSPHRSALAEGVLRRVDPGVRRAEVVQASGPPRGQDGAARLHQVPHEQVPRFGRQERFARGQSQPLTTR